MRVTLAYSLPVLVEVEINDDGTGTVDRVLEDNEAIVYDEAAWEWEEDGTWGLDTCSPELAKKALEIAEDGGFWPAREAL